MPKTVIIGDKVTMDSHDGEPFETQLSLHIGWDKGLPQGGVQLGVRGVDPETGEPNMTSVFITLDWAASNRAIGAIREARDQAHGAPA